VPLTDWSYDNAVKAAHRNKIIGVYGTPKTGKSQLAISTHLPLYVAHLDPNNNMQEHLLARHAKFPDAYTAEPVFIPVVPYKDLTEELAGDFVQRLERYFAEARQRAALRDEPGVLVIDGGKRLKGYVEKWKLGESATLGYRAEAGGHGPSQIQYAETNAYFNDLINAFVGSNLHVIVTFEAREKWVETRDDNNRKTRRPSGKYEPKMPGGREGELIYTLNALVETLVEAVPSAVVDNKQIYAYVHKIRFDVIGIVGMDYLLNRTMPATSLDDLLDLLNSNIPAETLVDAPHEIQRMDMGGLEEEAE
jgi:hypothetical protein